MSQSPIQQELFNNLNAPEGAGVFLFPPKFLKRDDNINALQATRNALAYLEGHLGDSKIKAKNSKGVSAILDWLENFRNRVTRESERLMAMTDEEFNGEINGRSSESPSPAKAGRAS